MKRFRPLVLVFSGIASLGCGEYAAAGPVVRPVRRRPVVSVEGPKGGKVTAVKTPSGNVVVAVKLPPPKVEVKPPQPAAGKWLWVGGHWEWNAAVNQYAWVSGRWERHRAGKTWVPGCHVQKGNIHVWVPGHWK
ncbi:MAG: YXWGXW repeat-containing protein [Planctomycetes bacterium]|nr:YXWGXW repeat-containing protein [Planctomycetota bacterium]